MFTGDKQNSYMSALSLRSSAIELSSSAQLQFINNSAVNGAGIHLVDFSSIILNSGSTVLFKHNTASGQGGAIYADTCILNQTGLEDCIFKHSNPALHPDDWGVNITFIDNQLISDGKANAIYADSVQFHYSLFNDTFCWKGWFYINDFGGVKENCTEHLSSGPAYVNYGPHDYTISLSDTLYDQVNFTIFDAWGKDITDPDKIPIELISGPAFTNQLNTLASSIHVDCSQNYTNQSSLLYIHPLQFPGFAVTIHFAQCADQYCGCSEPSPTHSPYPYDSDCMACKSPGKHGACPSSYIYTHNRSCVQGREEILCGNCIEEYAVAINDPDLSCTQCNYQYGVAIFLFLQLVPVLIMLTLLAIFHVNITDGGLSGFVLFSQMVTLQFPGLGYSSWVPSAAYSCFEPPASITIADYYHQYFLSIPLTVYSIWNLNFLNLDPVHFCIPHIDTAAEAILLQYTTAACPLVFIVVTYTWIKWYNNGYRLVVYTTRPVHQLLARFWQNFKIQPSLIDTYAGLILLSYMRFLATSAKLLKFTFVMDDAVHNYTVAFYYDANLHYFGWSHAAYGVLAILCLLVFVVTPTIVLLFYHLKSFQRCLTKCKLDRPGLHAWWMLFKAASKTVPPMTVRDGVFIVVTPAIALPLSIMSLEVAGGLV